MDTGGTCFEISSDPQGNGFEPPQWEPCKIHFSGNGLIRPVDCFRVRRQPTASGALASARSLSGNCARKSTPGRSWLCVGRPATDQGDRLQLSCSDSLGTDGHSSGAGDGRQAAISSDTKATDGTVPSVAYIEEAAVIAQ